VSTAFDHTAGEVKDPLQGSHDVTVLQADTDGDGQADFLVNDRRRTPRVSRALCW